MQVGGELTHTCHQATNRLLHNTNPKSANSKSLAKAWHDKEEKKTVVVKYVGGFWPIGVFFGGYRSFFFVPSRQTQTKARL